MATPIELFVPLLPSSERMPLDFCSRPRQVPLHGQTRRMRVAAVIGFVRGASGYTKGGRAKDTEQLQKERAAKEEQLQEEINEANRFSCTNE